jgi:hypothetical protein
MSFTVRVTHGLPYLLVQVQGPVALADLCAVADLAATVARMTGQRRALIDMLDMQLSMSFTDHLQLGTYVAAALQGLERVASVVSPAHRSGASEKAAQKSGLAVRAFTDLQEASGWVLEP